MCGIVHPAALIAIVGVSVDNGSHALLLVLGVIAGLALAPVSTAMRVAWGEAAGDDDRTAAYSTVYLIQELSLLTAPLIFAALTATTSAAVGLVVVAALTGVGTLAFAASARSVHSGHVPPREHRVSLLRIGRMRLLLASAASVGAVIGGIQVGVPTLATAHHKPAAAGVLIAMLSIGGIAGAAALLPAVGDRRRRAAHAGDDRADRLHGGDGGGRGSDRARGVAAAHGIGPQPDADDTVAAARPPHIRAHRRRAFGWLSTGIATGTGAAAAIAGALVQHGEGARPAFAVAAVAAASAALLALALRR